MNGIDRIKQQMLASCALLDQRGFVANHDGNISFRLEENLFLVTPTGFAKRSIEAEDLLLVDFSGRVIQGKHKVFSEWKWHQSIYATSPKASSVCHAHPPYAMAWGLTGRDLGYQAVPESLVSLGGPLKLVKLASPLAEPSEIEREVRFAMDSSYSFLVQGNGVFSVGDDPEMSYLRLELTEQIVRAHALALSIGGIDSSLPLSVVQSLIQKRPELKPIWQLGSEGALESMKEPAPQKKIEAFAPPAMGAIKELIRQEIKSLIK
jgi:L-fuculose-phosphate aldolase